MSERLSPKKKIDYPFRLLMGFSMIVSSANLIWILTSEHQIMILVSEAALAIGLLGYGIHRAGLSQRKSEEEARLSIQKYHYELEDYSHAAYFFNRGE